jgi:tRNA-specific 2-thiouridylase
MKVLAAMSGGVDSAVAAARAVDAGYDVTGVHLALSAKPATMREGARGCCTLEDARDARRAADAIGIPFYVWDLAERFGRDVVDDFVAEYAAGRTPNPCLRCNERIKFSAVLDRALALGFDAVCTGHHARLVDGQLYRSVDAGKDQSYVLGVLTTDQLSRAMFPLGDSTKEQVRAEARARGLLVADKPDSHDICFIADGDTAHFLTERLGAAPGDIVDADTGAVLGGHDGVHRFTVGQRKGLNVGRPAADGKPRYVLAVEPVTSTVTVGRAESLDVTRIVGIRPRWCGPGLDGPTSCLAQVRAHGDAVTCSASVEADRLLVDLLEPIRGVAPGQAVVLYDGDRVLGSATIDATRGALSRTRRAVGPARRTTSRSTAGNASGHGEDSS